MVQETIVLVHGTFAAPDAAHGPQWYEPKSYFIDTLDARLEALGSQARCWAHLSGSDLEIFSWTGANHWQDRTEAAKRLAADLDRLIREGWRCHIIAHSHGGNVVMEALRRMRHSTSPGYADAWQHGSIVTMGTPFIALDESLPARSKLSRLLGWAVSIICLWALTSVIVRQGLGGWRNLAALLHATPWYVFAIAACLIFGIMVVVQLLGALSEKALGAYDPPHVNQLLVMTSSEDEAWQLLHGLHSNHLKDRLARESKETWFSRVKLWLLRTVRLSIDADRVTFPSSSIFLDLSLWLGAAALLLPALALHRHPDLEIFGRAYAILCCAYAILITGTIIGHWRMGRAALHAPVRLITMIAFVVGAGFRNMVFRLGLAQMWNLATALATGLSDFPLRGIRISQDPPLVDGDFFKRIEIDASIIAQAIGARGNSAGLGLNELIAAAFDAKSSRDTFDQRLQQIAHNTHLCHAIYYSERTCITEIATWIARTEKEIGDF